LSAKHILGTRPTRISHTRSHRAAPISAIMPSQRRRAHVASAAPGSFGHLLRQFRIAAGLTQNELAQRAGLSTRGVQDLERGIRRAPHPDTARRLVAALGLESADRVKLLKAGPGARVGVRQECQPSVRHRVYPGTVFVGREREIEDLLAGLEDA